MNLQQEFIYEKNIIGGFFCRERADRAEQLRPFYRTEKR
jgi:hypothetical protein